MYYSAFIVKLMTLTINLNGALINDTITSGNVFPILVGDQVHLLSTTLHQVAITLIHIRERFLMIEIGDMHFDKWIY